MKTKFYFWIISPIFICNPAWYSFIRIVIHKGSKRNVYSYTQIYYYCHSCTGSDFVQFTLLQHHYRHIAMSRLLWKKKKKCKLPLFIFSCRDIFSLDNTLNYSYILTNHWMCKSHLIKHQNNRMFNNQGTFWLYPAIIIIYPNQVFLSTKSDKYL